MNSGYQCLYRRTKMPKDAFKFSGGLLTNYHGFGRPAKVLSSGTLGKNAAIIRETLNRRQEKGNPK